MLPFDFVNLGHCVPKESLREGFIKLKYLNIILIVGVADASAVVYCDFIISWQSIESVRNTDETLISSFTDVWIRRQDNCCDKSLVSSLKTYKQFFNKRKYASSWIFTYNVTTDWSRRSILFWTIIVGIWPHSFSTYNTHINQKQNKIHHYHLRFPIFDCLKRHSVRCAECQHACLGAPVVWFGYGVKLLLASGVPEHDPNIFSIQPISIKEEVAFIEFQIVSILIHTRSAAPENLRRWFFYSLWCKVLCSIVESLNFFQPRRCQQ